MTNLSSGLKIKKSTVEITIMLLLSMKIDSVAYLFRNVAILNYIPFIIGCYYFCITLLEYKRNNDKNQL